MLEAVKLQDSMCHLPSHLSGGSNSGRPLHKPLINDPVMIVADEANGNVDSRTSYEIMELIQELNGIQGETIA